MSGDTQKSIATHMRCIFPETGHSEDYLNAYMEQLDKATGKKGSISIPRMRTTED
jgi:hypothetical protein